MESRHWASAYACVDRIIRCVFAFWVLRQGLGQRMGGEWAWRGSRNHA